MVEVRRVGINCSGVKRPALANAEVVRCYTLVLFSWLVELAPAGHPGVAVVHHWVLPAR